MKVGWFLDCGQPLLEISVHSFLRGVIGKIDITDLGMS